MDYLLLLWLADVTENLHILSVLAATLLGTGGAAAFIGGKAEGEEVVARAGLIALVIAAAFCTLAAILPSKQTMHAIIAVKAGKDLSESQIGKKAADALEAILDDVIKKANK